MLATLLEKETLAQVFSCEFCEISKNTFSYRTPPVVASVASIDLRIWNVVTVTKKSLDSVFNLLLSLWANNVLFHIQFRIKVWLSSRGVFKTLPNM